MEFQNTYNKMNDDDIELEPLHPDREDPDELEEEETDFGGEDSFRLGHFNRTINEESSPLLKKKRTFRRSYKNN